MCLSLEWFEGSEERACKWDAEGVTPEEVASTLPSYYTTAWPAATELALWLYTNWTIRQLFSLDEYTRRTLIAIIENEFKPQEQGSA